MPKAHEVADQLRALINRLDRIGSNQVPNVDVYFIVYEPFGDEANRRAQVNELGIALTDQPGKKKRRSTGGWEHISEVRKDGFHLAIWTSVEAPAGEDPAALKARIAELEAKLASGGQS